MDLHLIACNSIAHRVFLFFLVIIFPASAVLSQSNNPYNFQDLSNTFYARQKDSIKKNWTCPVLYKEKETQKMYKGIWDERTSFITNEIESNDFVHDKDIYNYLDQVLTEITKGNQKLVPVKPVLFLDRSASVNAYNIGGNIIAVNAGLVAFAQYKEEIALVLAHELAHNILNHADNSMKERAEWFNSDEYKKSLNAVLDSKYERLTRLKKVFEGFSFSRSKHNRYHESDADSLAILLLKNSGIAFNPVYFLRLDSADIQYKQPLKNPLRNYLSVYNVPFEDWWIQKRSKGLSTKNYNFRDTSRIADSLKTHPDCAERYAKTLALSTSTGKETAVPPYIHDKANKILIWNMFDNLNLTACLYRILLQKDNGNKDEWYDFMIYNIFSGLYYSDKQLNRFNAIGVTPKEYISKDYLGLQNMLEQMPKDSLEQYCIRLRNVSFWNNMNNDARALKTLMNSLNFDTELSAKAIENSGKDFLKDYPNSMYCEFAEHFKKN